MFWFIILKKVTNYYFELYISFLVSGIVSYFLNIKTIFPCYIILNSILELVKKCKKNIKLNMIFITSCKNIY